MTVRDVVKEAHEYVALWQEENGDIPKRVIPRMQHHLAHCYMSVVLSFLKGVGLQNPGDLKDMQKFALDNGWVSRYWEGNPRGDGR